MSKRDDDDTISKSTDQDDAMKTLISKVESCDQIDLLEYAAMTPLPLIREIKRKNVRVRILIHHPEMVESMQRQRTVSTIDTLYSAVFKDPDDRVEIRCYRLPYSVRGRHFYGKLVELGWLTPDVKTKTAHGTINPSFLIDLSRGGNDFFLNFFNRTFDDYWDHESTEGAREVLERERANDANLIGTTLEQNLE